MHVLSLALHSLATQVRDWVFEMSSSDKTSPVLRMDSLFVTWCWKSMCTGIRVTAMSGSW